MERKAMKRQYTICTEHLIIIKDEDKGSCSQCNGDRNLIGVVAIADLKEEYLCQEHGYNKDTSFWNNDSYGDIRRCGCLVNDFGKHCAKVVEIGIPWRDNKDYEPR